MYNGLQLLVRDPFVAMYDFFVLGFIPGTHIQITFQDWINTVAVVMILWLALKLYLQRRTILSLGFSLAEATTEPYPPVLVTPHTIAILRSGKSAGRLVCHSLAPLA